MGGGTLAPPFAKFLHTAQYIYKWTPAPMTQLPAPYYRMRHYTRLSFSWMNQVFPLSLVGSCATFLTTLTTVFVPIQYNISSMIQIELIKNIINLPCHVSYEFTTPWRKSEWNFGRNCSDLCGHHPVIKRFTKAVIHVNSHSCKLSDCFPFQQTVS